MVERIRRQEPSRGRFVRTWVGSLQLRMNVNGSRGAIDTDEREVTVPDMTAAELAMATPKVFIARAARDFQLIRKDPAAVPTASREFRRTARLVVRVEAYAPGNQIATIMSRLLSKQGARLADIPAMALRGEPNLTDLSLAALAPSEYLLEPSATAEGQEPYNELIAFRVEG